MISPFVFLLPFIGALIYRVRGGTPWTTAIGDTPFRVLFGFFFGSIVLCFLPDLWAFAMATAGAAFGACTIGNMGVEDLSTAGKKGELALIYAVRGLMSCVGVAFLGHYDATLFGMCAGLVAAGAAILFQKWNPSAQGIGGLINGYWSVGEAMFGFASTASLLLSLYF